MGRGASRRERRPVGVLPSENQPCSLVPVTAKQSAVFKTQRSAAQPAGSCTRHQWCQPQAGIQMQHTAVQHGTAQSGTAHRQAQRRCLLGLHFDQPHLLCRLMGGEDRSNGIRNDNRGVRVLGNTTGEMPRLVGAGRAAQRSTAQHSAAHCNTARRGTELTQRGLDVSRPLAHGQPLVPLPGLEEGGGRRVGDDGLAAAARLLGSAGQGGRGHGSGSEVRAAL